MRHALALAALVLAGPPAAGQRPAPAGEPIYWGQHGLAIPYRWASGADAGAASEVVLYVAAGPAGEFRQVATAAPTVSSFLYQAPADGEYRFAVRTYDRYGAFRPPGPLRAEMRVVVDTRPPGVTRLEGELRGGFARVSVDASDDTAIDPSTLTLHYQTDPYSGWAPAALTPAGLRGGTHAASVAEFRVPTGTRTLSLRVNVSDRAGNPAERTATIADGSAATGLAGPRMTPSPAAVAAKNPFDALGASPPPTWGAEPAPPAPPVERAAGSRGGWTSAGDASRAAKVATRGPQDWPVDSGRTRLFATDRGRPSGPGEKNRLFSNASLGSDPVAAPRDAFFNEPAGRVDRTVKSRRFEFDYDLSDVGRWGVATVELWGTEDDGATWRRFAIDNDRQSPIHVEAPGQGVFGFRLLVEAVGGLPPERPRPGDRPEVTVCVDLERPAAVLTRVEQGQGYLGDQLTIDWRVDERRPAARPIDLYYSNQPDGPWAPIATGLDDTGRYAWRLQRHVPERLYVRLEARDDAGNVGVAVTPEAVELRLPKPSARLRGVRSRETVR